MSRNILEQPSVVDRQLALRERQPLEQCRSLRRAYPARPRRTSQPPSPTSAGRDRDRRSTPAGRPAAAGSSASSPRRSARRSPTRGVRTRAHDGPQGVAAAEPSRREGNTTARSSKAPDARRLDGAALRPGRDHMAGRGTGRRGPLELDGRHALDARPALPPAQTLFRPCPAGAGAPAGPRGQYGFFGVRSSDSDARERSTRSSIASARWACVM